RDDGFRYRSKPRIVCALDRWNRTDDRDNSYLRPAMKRTLLILALLCASPLLAQQQIPITGGVVTADLSSGVTSFKVNLNQNVTSVVLTGQHPGSGGNTVVCTLFFVQDATGGWTVTFGGNITGG